MASAVECSSADERSSAVECPSTTECLSAVECPSTTQCLSAVECPPTTECLSAPGDMINMKRAAKNVRETTGHTRPFIEKVMGALYEQIHESLGSCVESSSSPHFFSTKELLHSFEEFQSGQHDFWRMLQLNVIRSHSSFLGTVKVSDITNLRSWLDFKQRAKNVEIAWNNSPAETWMNPERRPFALAKCFCRSLSNENPETFDDLGANAFLRITYRCKAFGVEPCRILSRPTSRDAVDAYKDLCLSAQTRKMDTKMCESIQQKMSVYLRELQEAERRFPTPASLAVRVALFIK